MSGTFAELHCHSNFSFLDGASSVEDLVERAVELRLPGLAITDHQGLYGAVRFATAAHEAGLNAIVGMEVELLDPIAADPDGIVIPRRRPIRRGRQMPISESVPSASLEAIAPDPQLDGRAVRPSVERLRPPGHREARREDPRGVRARELGPHLVLLARDMSGYRSLCRLASNAQLAGTKGAPKFNHDRLKRETQGLIALSGCRHGEIARRLLAGDREGAKDAARRLAAVFPDAFYLELQHHLLPDDDWLLNENVQLPRR